MARLWTPGDGDIEKFDAEQLYNAAVKAGLAINIIIVRMGSSRCAYGLDKHDDWEHAKCDAIPKEGTWFLLGSQAEKFFCKYHFAHLLAGLHMYQEDILKSKKRGR